MYDEPCLVSVDRERGLDLTVAFKPNQALAGRLRNLTPSEQTKFMEEGPGRKVLDRDSIVVFFNDKRPRGQREEKLAKDSPLPIDVVAVGIVSGRQNIFGRKEGKQETKHQTHPGANLLLHVNVTFPEGVALPEAFLSAIQKNALNCVGTCAVLPLLLAS